MDGMFVAVVQETSEPSGAKKILNTEYNRRGEKQ